MEVNVRQTSSVRVVVRSSGPGTMAGHGSGKGKCGGPKGTMAPMRWSGKVVHSVRMGKGRRDPEPHGRGEEVNYVTSPFQRESSVGRIWR